MMAETTPLLFADVNHLWFVLLITNVGPQLKRLCFEMVSSAMVGFNNHSSSTNLKASSTLAPF